MKPRIVLALVLLLATAPAVHAQPAGDKTSAKALMQTGVRLIEAKDYLGALAIFKDAYVRFPSAKILLNIGTTYTLLDRKADAANTYQRYLDSSDADPARRPEVTAALAELDKAVGKLAITVMPADAEVMVTDEWIPAANAKLMRVTPGNFTVQARRGGYTNTTRNGTVAVAAQTDVALELTAIPKEVVTTTIHDGLGASAEPEEPRSKIGAIAVVHVSVLPKIGGAWLVGATFDATEQLTLDAAVLLGPGLVSDGMATLPPPSFGAFAGAHFAFMTGKLRPRAGAGIPMFFSDGARFFVRAAGGIEYIASRHLAVAFDLGAEVALNPQNDIREIAVVPAFGVSGRL